jgi:hypothetical protein
MTKTVKIEFEFSADSDADKDTLHAFAYLGALLADFVFSDEESRVPAKREELLEDLRLEVACGGERRPTGRALLRDLIRWSAGRRRPAAAAARRANAA